MQAPEPSSGRRQQDILRQALTRKTPQERAAFLDGACGDDSALRAEIEALLTVCDAVVQGPALTTEPANTPLAQGATELTPTLLDETPVTEGPGTIIGHYKLLEQIGEGGFGVVYVAEQREPVKRQVALKIIKLGMDTRQVVARFEAERQALALMDHPNIAKVFDAGATNTGRPFFVMELVKGVPITHYCDREKLGTSQRLDLFIRVCQAVQHAHQKGIIHRDIKPTNILVAVQEGKPLPKVIDFGIAKATQQKLTEKTLHTQLQQFIGTPAYMSPEQAEMSGSDIDTRSDIYSLGVLLYELLVGKTPFDSTVLLAAGLDEIRRTIREKEPTRPSTRLSTMGKEELTTTTQRRGTEAPKLISLLRGDLDWIVMKCLEKDRTRRYDTANGLAMDLQRHLDNEPVVARPPSAAYRLQKAWRRNKVVFTAAAVVVAALVVGIGASSWQAIVASRARKAEKQQRLAAQAAQKKAENAQAAENQERLRADAEKTEARRFLYVAQMNLAQQAWEQNNIGRLRQLLDDTRDSLNCGFEWYYWQRQTHLASKTLRGHLDFVTSVAFSPDGQRIVTGSGDNTAKVWAADTGRELLTLKGHRADVRSVVFSPDGQRIVSGSWDQIAMVWEATTGKQLVTLKGHSGGVSSVAFSPDGQRIVTGSFDNTAKVWDAVSGKELLALKGHSAFIWAVAFSPDGQRIVTGSADQTATIWEAATGKELVTLKGHNHQIDAVAFSPDGRRVVTGSLDQTAKIWDAITGQELLALKGHSHWVQSVAFSPDGQRIVTGSFDNTAKVWETASGRDLLTLRGHSGEVIAVAFSPDGQWIVTSSGDQTVKVWDAVSGGELVPLQGHTDRIRSAAFSPDGRWIVTGSQDQTAIVWEAATSRRVLTLRGHNRGVSSVAFSPDGHRIVTGSEDQTAKVWEAATGRELLTLTGHTDRVSCVAFSPDGQRIVTGSWDQTARVWDAVTSRGLLTLKGHSHWVMSAAFSPDGQRIVTGSQDQTAKLWEASSGHELLTLTGHSGEIRSVAFSLDGHRIVTGSEDQTAKVWETATARELVTLKGHTAGLWSVAFSPDGRRIITGGEDQTAKLWEAATGRELLTLKGHTDRVCCVAFSPDGRRIVTASRDRTAKVWEAASVPQVNAWQNEDKTAEEHLAVLRRQRAEGAEHDRLQRAQDAGAIRQWLVLAPIGFSGSSGAAALNLQQIPNEAQLRPTVGERIQVDASQRTWRAVQLEDYQTDFNQLLGDMTQFSVAYAVTYIQSEADRRHLLMKVGSDDQSKVYLNGRELCRRETGRTYVADQDVVTGVDLKAGLNVVVFKVVNETADWKGSLRFTDAQGKPIEGIRVTLDPEAKDPP